jgi:hypothetical protein
MSALAAAKARVRGQFLDSGVDPDGQNLICSGRSELHDALFLGLTPFRL